MDMKYRQTLLRRAFKDWRYIQQCEKQRSRVVNYWRNDRFRRKLRLVFEGWRGVTHEWFKERLDNEKGQFRQELEGRLLVQWRDKVDAQVLYMAQLEEKIKNEVEAREKLAQTYERSLNTGVNHLNNET